MQVHESLVKSTGLVIVQSQVWVCKAKDHQAGFVGSIYIDCPNKPCFLCKKQGHTTASCPHRVATEHGVSPASRRHSSGMIEFVLERQLGNHPAVVKPSPVIPNRVDCAIIKLHSRRVTSLEFHPTKDNILISGDKKGQIGIWDFEKVYDKTVHGSIHSCIVNSIKFHPKNDGSIFTSGSDGNLCSTDLEIGLGQTLLDLNPNGWSSSATWRMIYGMDVNGRRDLVLAGDNFGLLHQLDMRTNRRCGNPLLIHKKNTKVVGLHCNPVDPDIFLTCGNDHMARIWDYRALDSNKELACLSHPRVVNSAYFSPVSGNKILSTCQDNRIRVWDCIFGDLQNPSREIVHSHDFNRYLTCFRAEWDPKDHTECMSVIGRYISDDFDGVALHPIDFIDVSTGQLVAQVVDHNLTTISPVNKLHPTLDVLATGSSRSLFIWRPKDDLDGPEEQEKSRNNVSIYNVGESDEVKKRKKGKFNEDEQDDDDDDIFCRKKQEKNVKTAVVVKVGSSTNKKPNNPKK
ncbi:hypothetical protein O6H91_16G025800 [Diphasiastrum complanatum]|uniref:Uncharacterized protein n=3 Tax=Diphasiastrum complanatum TaxID=34168 RepID=A0ACC2BAS5_DIPCM|nr:hypothetical protein O6H91_16G025800 [Diphasiastrum complanatum]